MRDNRARGTRRRSVRGGLKNERGVARLVGLINDRIHHRGRRHNESRGTTARRRSHPWRRGADDDDDDATLLVFCSRGHLSPCKLPERGDKTVTVRDGPVSRPLPRPGNGHPGPFQEDEPDSKTGFRCGLKEASGLECRRVG